MAAPALGTNRKDNTHKLLPIYNAGGSEEPRFLAIKAKELAIAKQVAAMSLEELRRYPLLSANAKTSASVDFPVGHTCNPTALCASVCYATGPRAAMAWPQSVRKRMRNLRYFKLEEPHEAAWKLGREFKRARRFWERRGVTLDYLRINGGGDLFPELVPVLNYFSAHFAGIRLWIVTRRLELAAQIEPRPNVFLQLSLDASTPPELVERARFLTETHPRAYLSFLRMAADDDTHGAAIVFNEKRTSGLPYHGRTDCPVDAGRLALGNVRGVGGDACAKCRKCFSEKTLERQRERLYAAP
jgi:hypothetical protein